MRPRAIAKRILQSLVGVIGPHRWKQKDALLVLMYHRILPKTDPQYGKELPGMVVEPETFRMHLRLLKKYFSPIQIGDWLEKARHNNTPLPRSCAITFDDGWQDNFRYAFPILLEEQVPATIFLVSDLVGTANTLWYRKVLHLVHAAQSDADIMHTLMSFCARFDFHSTSPIRAADLDRLIEHLKSYDDMRLDSQLTEILEGLERIQAPPGEILSWEEIRKMSASGFIEFGSHTRHHLRLKTGISAHDATEEVVTSAQIITRHTGTATRVFCYPNGDTCTESIELVRKHYIGACTTQKGWHSTQSDHSQIKRIGIHQDISSSKSAFLARLSGWM